MAKEKKEMQHALVKSIAVYTAVALISACIVVIPTVVVLVALKKLDLLNSWVRSPLFYICFALILGCVMGVVGFIVNRKWPSRSISRPVVEIKSLLFKRVDEHSHVADAVNIGKPNIKNNNADEAGIAVTRIAVKQLRSNFEEAITKILDPKKPFREALAGSSKFELSDNYYESSHSWIQQVFPNASKSGFNSSAVRFASEAQLCKVNGKLPNPEKVAAKNLYHVLYGGDPSRRDNREFFYTAFFAVGFFYYSLGVTINLDKEKLKQGVVDIGVSINNDNAVTKAHIKDAGNHGALRKTRVLKFIYPIVSAIAEKTEDISKCGGPEFQFLMMAACIAKSFRVNEDEFFPGYQGSRNKNDYDKSIQMYKNLVVNIEKALDGIKGLPDLIKVQKSDDGALVTMEGANSNKKQRGCLQNIKTLFDIFATNNNELALKKLDYACTGGKTTKENSPPVASSLHSASIMPGSTQELGSSRA